MGNKTYIADKETLDDVHANTKALLAAVGDNEHFKPKRYGFKVNKNDSNPKTRITYILDATNFTPASMNYATGVFDYGSWADIWFIKNNFPCMLKYDGSVDYKLNQRNYALKEDGTQSDVANVAYGGNAMSAMPLIWYSQYEANGYEYHVFCEEKFDDTYHAYCHEREDGSIAKYRYFPMFEGYYDGTRIRSISGVTPTANQNGATEMTRIQANGEHWDSITWNMVNLMKGLLTLISKSDDSQTAFGNGNCSSDVYLNTGTLNEKGQFFGYNNTTQAMKVFHCENWYGNYWKRLRGMVQDHGVVKVQMKPPYSDNGANYHDTGLRVAGNTGGYIKDTLNTEYGRVPAVTGGSSSTYLCDYYYYNGTILGYALFGGLRGSGLNCGALYVYLGLWFSSAHSYVVASLSCEQPL